MEGRTSGYVFLSFGLFFISFNQTIVTVAHKEKPNDYVVNFVSFERGETSGHS